MNKFSSFLFGASLLLSTSLSAESAEDYIGITGTLNPFFGKMCYDNINDSKICEGRYKGDKIQYQVAEGDLGSMVYINPCHREGAILNLDYTYTYMNWDENPSFDQTAYNTMGTTLIFFTNRVPNWTWRAFVKLNMNLDHFDFEQYSTWDILLWGKYCYSECFGIHMGFYAQTGMMVDRVLPVIGFDWQYSDRIKIDGVFPVDLKVMYELNCRWSTGLCVHMFRTRQRAEKNAPIPYAVWTYENWGIEGCIQYKTCEMTYLNLHAGYASGGKLKIADKHYDKKHHYKFGSAFMYGAELALKF